MSYRKNILALFNNQKFDFNPVFSGLISVTKVGLRSEGMQFCNTIRMAWAAASTYWISGFEVDA